MVNDNESMGGGSAEYPTVAEQRRAKHINLLNVLNERKVFIYFYLFKM